MARIVEPPQPQTTRCNSCRALIEYLPEEVESQCFSHFDDFSVERFVKCPRPGCPGRGIVREGRTV